MDTLWAECSDQQSVLALVFISAVEPGLRESNRGSLCDQVTQGCYGRIFGTASNNDCSKGFRAKWEVLTGFFWDYQPSLALILPADVFSFYYRLHSGFSVRSPVHHRVIRAVFHGHDSFDERSRVFCYFELKAKAFVIRRVVTPHQNVMRVATEGIDACLLKSLLPCCLDTLSEQGVRLG